MEQTIIACAFLIAMTLQWQTHQAKNTVSFWADTLPIIIIGAYLGYKFFMLFVANYY